MLWKGYRTEDASWVEDKLVTAAALRYFVGIIILYSYSSFLHLGLS